MMRSLPLLLALALGTLSGCSSRSGASSGPAGQPTPSPTPAPSPGSTDAGSGSPGSTPDGGTDPGPALQGSDTPSTSLPPFTASELISAENARAGESGWAPTHIARAGQLAAYALASSVRAGEPLRIAAAASTPGKLRFRIYRMGAYGGARARLVTQGGPLDVGAQPGCPTSDTGLTACGWTPTFTVDTSGFVRGVYVARLDLDGGVWQTLVPFVVRDDAATPQVVMLVPTATWQAYNTWGGESLYDDGQHRMPSGRAFQVSFDRPYVRDAGAGDLLTHDLSLITWLEAQGVDVGYVTSEDVDARALPSGMKVLLLSGHDEYWSGPTRDRVEQAVASGVSLLSLGANNAYWQIRFESAKDARDGRGGRTITCYKTDAPARDPVGASSPQLTVRFRDPPVNRPESALLGIAFNGHWNQFGLPARITAGTHWALADTGLHAGDALWRGAGYEADEVTDGSPADVELLARSPVTSLQSGPAITHMAIRKQGKALVFAAGGIDFVGLLSNPDQADPRAQRLVANVLFRALGTQRPTLVEFTSPAQASQGPAAHAARVVGGLAGKAQRIDGAAGTAALQFPIAVAPLPGGAVGVLDGAAVRRIDSGGAIHTLATLNLLAPAGLAADAQGNLYASDSAGCTLFQVKPDGTSRLIAGASQVPGSTDGPGASARFINPSGLTVTRDGALLVADMGTGTIRRVELKSGQFQVSTVASGLARPTGVAEGPDGSLAVAETGLLRVVRIHGGSIEPLAGQTVVGFADGAAGSALVMPLFGVAVLGDGSVVFSDPGNGRVRRIRSGQVSTLAGGGTGSGDSSAPQTLDLSVPSGLAVGPDGSVLVAELGAGLVRSITP